MFKSDTFFFSYGLTFVLCYDFSQCHRHLNIVVKPNNIVKETRFRPYIQYKREVFAVSCLYKHDI